MELLEPRPRTAQHAEWLRLRRELWPQLTGEQNEAESAAWLANPNTITLLAADDAGRVLGFIEAGERSYGEGCDTSPVGYIEGWYVIPEARARGIGRKLVEAAERWARSRRLVEMASDAEIDNLGSQAAHRRLGYEETDRIVTFRKRLV